MKEFFRKSTFCLAAAALAVCAACNSSETPVPPEPPVPPTPSDYTIDVQATSALAAYGGDLGGVYGYFLALGDVKVTSVDPKADGAGQIVVFEMYSKTGSAENFTEGTYTMFAGSDEDELTPPCFVGETSGYYVTNADGVAGELEPLTNGTVTIKGSGSNYEIEVLGTFADGRTLRFTYTGAMEIKEESGETPDIPLVEEDIDATYTTAIATYHGEYESKGSGLYNLTLYTGELSGSGWNQMPAEVGGLMLQLTLFSSLPNPDMEIEPGTYTVNDNGSKGSWLAGFIDERIYWPNGTYLEQIQENYSQECLMAATGTITIARDGDNYSVTLDLTSDTGHKMTGTFHGPISFYDRANVNNTLSTLTEDTIVHVEDMPAKAGFYGDLYDVKGDNWYLEIGTFAVGSENMQLDLMAPQTGYKGELPEGTYTVSETYTQGEYAVVPGERSAGGMLAYSWYVADIRDDGASYHQAPAKKGTITISKSGSDYIISFEFFDDQNPAYKFWGSWTGPIEISNQSKAPAGKARSSKVCKRANAASLLEAAAKAPAVRAPLAWFAEGQN